MKILFAPDSFKGSLSAATMCDIANNIATQYFPDISLTSVAMADGGEGTVDSLVQARNGKLVNIEVSDPLLRLTSAKYGILDDGTAVIEIAEAAGLHKLTMEERNPLLTSTYGVGEIIKHALDKDCRNFIIGIGGSATNDCGLGLIMALGANVTYANGKTVTANGLGMIAAHNIDLSSFDPRINKSNFTIACDVNNPLVGENGAAYIYAPQKGANIQQVIDLNEGLVEYAKTIYNATKVEVANYPGAGAAGGLGAAFLAFFNGRLNKGVEIVLDANSMADKLDDVKYVITGEGKIDKQTMFGKVPYGVARLTKQNNKNIKVIGICGILDLSIDDLYKSDFDSAYSILTKCCNEVDAIAEAEDNLKQLLFNLFATLREEV